MTKIRKIILAVLISCMAVCAGAAIAACTDKSGAPFRMPVGFNPDDDFNGRYTISVTSAGGLPLSGVKVDAKKGSTTYSGISNGGYINLQMTPDVYQLVVDESTLPDGYYLDGTQQYYTRPDEGNVEIIINSGVVPATAPSNKVYSIGDVMYDFAFTDAVTNTKYQLSELLNERTGYKAVVLNFFYVGCSPCRAEFPAIEEAYKAYDKELAIVALSYQDSSAAIADFAKERGLTFHTAYDSSGMSSRFSVSAFPTTVVVDRFGIVAARSEGGEFEPSYWRNLFLHFTSDDYVQTPPEGGDPIDPGEFTRPPEDMAMPTSEEINAVLTGRVENSSSVDRYYGEEGNDKEYSWPWVIKGSGKDAYLDASNVNFDYSFATLYAQITLAAGDAISYEYYVNTEAECDNLYVFVDGSIVAVYNGNSEGWKEEKAVYIANRDQTVELAFMYYKNLDKSVDNERASIKNLNILPAKDLMDTIDLQTLVITGADFNKNNNHPLTGAYGITVTENTDNGYYYYNGALLLADILSGGEWAARHLGTARFENPEGNREAASVYHLSYWEMSNYDRADKESPLLFNYLTPAQSEKLIESYYLQGFSDNGLIPVTRGLIEILNAFVDAMYKDHSDMFIEGDQKYAGQWLEFCYYFKHEGSKLNHVCYEEIDPVEGLIYDNALTVKEGKNDINITKILNLSDGGGLKYKFEPEKTGVYLFYSKADTAKGIDPKLFIFDQDKKTCLLEVDNDMRYDNKIYSDSNDEFYAYIWLEQGRTYYVHGAMHVPGDTGAYEMHIEYKGTETVSFLRFASTGGGMFTYNVDPYYFYYLAVGVAQNPADGLYYHYYRNNDGNYQFGSKIYIDFIHQNYFERNGRSIKQMIDMGTFDLRENGGHDYTGKITSYYEKAIANEGELYGLVEANEELVSILGFICQLYLEEGVASGAWEMFACYYDYIGNPND